VVLVFVFCLVGWSALFRDLRVTGPVIVPLDSGLGGWLPWMSRGGEVVILPGDFPTEIVVVRDIGSSLIGKDTSFFGGEGGPSFGGRLGGNLRV
jgi:hypothetical protein